jgi:CheY-like chemotaxis protein
MGLGLLRVLLVEDEHLIRLMASEMLRDEGFDVEEASSGDEAALRLIGPQ